MKNKTIDFITMGCSKNLVDSETLMSMFERNGYHCTHDSENPQGDIVVINTCGFIEDAKQESINAILELAKAKDEGRIKQLYVMGCLSQRYQEELKAEIPQVDKFYGKFNYKQLLTDLGHPQLESCTGPRHLTTPHHYAYIKISEGCDRHCAYCAIPIMTGRHISRPQREILDEMRELVAHGTTEFQVIAQELTYYGVDVDGHQHIADLVSAMANIPGVRWIRLHYAYPSHFPWDLLHVIRNNSNVCNYLDIALQHVSDNVLKRMQRHFTKAETYELVRRLRREVPGIHLRTTLMVGFPGETDEDFEELKEFVRWARFERMGGFVYSEEDGTPSATLYADDVPAAVKRRRLSELMALQQQISGEVQAAKVGQTLCVVIDRVEGDYYVGRSEYSSPEVDPEVLIERNGKELQVGCFYDVTITASDDFDLYGMVVI